MTTANAVLDRARFYLNRPTLEIPDGSNNVKDITDWYGVRGAWCAMFVSRVFWDSGMPLPASTAKGFAWCSAGADWFRSQGRCFTDPRKAQPGDLLFFEWGQTAGGYDHIGIVESVRSDGLVTIEGNIGNKVQRLFRSWNSGIRELARPAFTQAPVVNPTPPTPGGEGLRRGSTGMYVGIMQKILTNAGVYNGAIDGIFGAQTEAAVKAWQTKLNLPADGVWGPATHAATEQILAYVNGLKPDPIGPGNRGEDVRNIQKLLASWKYYTGALDGIFGPQTEAALRRFQTDAKIPVDGRWGSDDQRAAWNIAAYLKGLSR